MSIKAIVVIAPFRCHGQVLPPETALEVGQGCDVTLSEARSLVSQKKAEWIPEDEIEIEEDDDE